MNQRDWLTSYVKLQTQEDFLLDVILRDTLRDIDKSKNSLDRLQLKLLLNEMWDKVKIHILEGQVKSARLALLNSLNWDRKLLLKYFSTSDLKAIEQFLVSKAKRNLKLALDKEDSSLSEKVYKTKVLTQGWLDVKIRSSLARGISAQDLAREVKSFVIPDTPGGASFAARRLARTEINNAYHGVSIGHNNEKPWNTGMAWSLSRSHPGNDVCNDLVGSYPLGKVPGKPHPQCVTEDTLIQFAGLKPDAATSRWHSGDIINLYTRNGRHLSVTPNHPILTVNGWIVASKLNKQSSIICGSLLHKPAGFSSSNPNKENMPSLAKDIFSSFSESFGVSSSSIVRVMPEDFHGDGKSSDVAVIRTNSFLQNDIFDPSILQPLFEDDFDRAYSDLLDFSRVSIVDKSFSGLRNSSDSFISSNGISLVFFGSSFGMNQSHSLGFSSQGNPDSLEEVAQTQMAYGQAQDCDNLLRGFAGPVELDDLVELTVGRYEGHVYNFQSPSGWYIANGIIAHNCLCYIYPETISEQAFLVNVKAGMYRDWMKDNYDAA